MTRLCDTCTHVALDPQGRRVCVGPCSTRRASAAEKVLARTAGPVRSAVDANPGTWAVLVVHDAESRSFLTGGIGITSEGAWDALGRAVDAHRAGKEAAS